MMDEWRKYRREIEREVINEGLGDANESNRRLSEAECKARRRRATLDDAEEMRRIKTRARIEKKKRKEVERF